MQVQGTVKGGTITYVVYARFDYSLCGLILLVSDENMTTSFEECYAIDKFYGTVK
jgi:hypothetical protein